VGGQGGTFREDGVLAGICKGAMRVFFSAYLVLDASGGEKSEPQMITCTVSIDGIIKHRDCLINIVMGAKTGCEIMVTEKVKRELEMLKRHLIILKYVVENEPIGILKLADETGIPSHKVRYSLRVLEQEGLIAASAPGAVTTERTKTFLKDLDLAIDQLQDMVKGLKEVEIKR
jgi:predicted transcriptional regulator